MPTFTAIALDTLLEPGGASRSSTKTVNGVNPVPNSKLQRRNSTSTVGAAAEKKYHWTQISPSLYTTPEATPIPDSPCSFPPSPYIINHKRRGPRLLKSYSEDDVSSHKKPLDEENLNGTVTDAEPERISLPRHGNVSVQEEIVEIERMNGIQGKEMGICTANDNVSGRCISSNSDEGSQLFYDQQRSNSFRSDTDGEDNSYKLSTPTVFYDACEELSSDGASQSAARDVDAEIREMRLSLLMEIEKRKQAEESLINMRSQWQQMREHLSLAGLTLPADPIALAGEHFESDLAEDLCQQLYLARFVANSIGRGSAKAEIEEEMESQIEAKNLEIARLCDRLHYYEAVNQEMSQRNQEVVEMARRDRQRRKKRQRWVWGSIAAAITLGTATLAWSFCPSGRGGLHVFDDYQDSEHHDAA